MSPFAAFASRRPAGPSRTDAPPAAPEGGAEAEAEAEEPASPGWWESSWDLLRGLDVCEASPAEPCAPRAGTGGESPKRRAARLRACERLAGEPPARL
jgi:hypothetical protein